jgi:hypothetical protein
MATEAQIEANRANAQKSTGPRTPEGKAIVAQNAITHGLLARAGVIPGEQEHEFEAHREGLLAQLRPGAPLEEDLAERIVDLSWRLKRAGRDQEVAYAALYQKYLEDQPQPQEPDAWHAALGRMIVEDFCGPAVLERLQRYERRIESSFYKALNELRQAARQRLLEAALEVPPMPARRGKEGGKAKEVCDNASLPGAVPATKPISAGGPTHPAVSPAAIAVPRRIGRMLKNNGAKQSQFRRESQRRSPEFGALSLPLALAT